MSTNLIEMVERCGFSAANGVHYKNEAGVTCFASRKELKRCKCGKMYILPKGSPAVQCRCGQINGRVVQNNSVANKHKMAKVHIVAGALWILAATVALAMGEDSVAIGSALGLNVQGLCYAVL